MAVFRGAFMMKAKALNERGQNAVRGGGRFSGRARVLLIVSVLVVVVVVLLVGYVFQPKLGGENGVSGGGNNGEQPSVRDAFLEFAVANNITLWDAENFYGNYTSRVEKVFPNNSSMLLPEIKLFSKDSVTYAELKRNVSNDPRVSMDRDLLLSKASQQFLDLGLHNSVNVLNPETGEYVSQPLSNHTIQSVSNATLAAMQRNLPLLSREAYFKLGNATQLNPDIVDFSQIILTGKEPFSGKEGFQVDFWKDYDKVDLNHYTTAMDLEQSPYVLYKPESFEFFNGLLRQHNLVLDKVGLNPADEMIRQTYVKPDIDYYYQYLPTKKINVNGTELTFPLLPLLNKTKMNEWFPDKVDRAVIYASQYPVQLTYFNAKTGEYAYSGDQVWTEQCGQKALLDGMNLVWNGGKWGAFEGKLFDRIIKAYTDKDWDSYYNGEGSDHLLARYYYNDWELEFFKNIYKDFEKPTVEFQEKYDPVLARDIVMDLGFRFGDIAIVDDIGNYDSPLPHQLRTFQYMLNSKALGYGGIEILAEDPSYPYFHETFAGAVPKYLLDQLPEGRYSPGKMISTYVYGYDSSNNPLKLIVSLPTGEIIEF